jgi:hypothetical protein
LIDILMDNLKSGCWFSALTLMVPFTQIDSQSAFPEAFNTVGYPALGNTIALGIIVGLVGGLVGEQKWFSHNLRFCDCFFEKQRISM